MKSDKFTVVQRNDATSERFGAFCDLTDLSRDLDRLHALIVLLEEYEVGERGHDGTTYLGLTVARTLASTAAKKARSAAGKRVFDEMKAEP